MAYLAALSLSSGMRAGFAAVSGIALGLIIYGVIAVRYLMGTVLAGLAVRMAFEARKT